MSSLHEKIGQMLVFGWQADNGTNNATEFNVHAEKIVKETHAGGIIIFTRNVADKTQLKEVITQFQTINKQHHRLPLFVSVDQEGGPVRRLKEPHFTFIPSATQIGECNTEDILEKDNISSMYASQIADDLLSVGINFNLAPVLDVNTNPNNPVIGTRSYGNTPEIVSRNAIAAIQTYNKRGILSCGKHFPGHGDTSVDSHVSLPIVPHKKERLEQIELVPFRNAIDANIPAIMTGHLFVTELDGKLPASISYKVTTELLRQELEFKGLIVTDCLEMRGICSERSVAEAALLAVQAGADIILVSHTWKEQIGVFNGLVQAVESGKISESRIDESVERILKVKAKL
jgi:beta-N-acetylhexosaminidase